MRVALISLLERLDGGSAIPLGLQRVGGRSIARQQLELALQMGCERIVCLSEGMHEGVPALQQAAEKAGAKFHVIRGTRPLSGLVTAADEVLILADGILPDAERVQATIGARPAILLFASEPALAAGFERVDAAHCWAGVALLRGSTIEHLSKLPEDFDPISALLRIGLQAGTKQLVLPAELLDTGEWMLVRSADQLERAGQRQVSRLLEPAPWSAPALALVDRVVGGASAWLMEKGIGSAALGGATVALSAAAVATAHYGSTAAGLFALLPAALSGRASSAISRLSGRGQWFAAAMAGVIDLALLAIAAIHVSQSLAAQGMFAPLVALALMLICGRILPGKWKFVPQDRPVFILILAVATIFGGFTLVFQMVALALLLGLLLASRGSRIITA